MAVNVKQLIEQLPRIRRRHARYVAVVSCIALVVALGVELGLRRIGITLTHEETVLDCHYDGNGAHTHTSDCYDENGNLVCPLPERELHIHDDSCYTTETHLICGQEESEDHVHADACYETTRSLTCDKEELTEEHVHGPSCFTTITVPGSVTTSAPAATPDSSVTPAQTFTDELKDPDNNDKVILQVHVEAPEGAFPEGTTMHIEPVDAQDIQEAVDEALAKKTDAKVMDIQAVDITFHDGDDNEIEPAKEITVVLTSDLIKDNDDPLVVHVDDKGKADVVETLNDRQIVEHDLTPEEDKLVFDSNKFSTYGIVITSLHGTLTSGDNNTYDINVEVPAAAGIPQGAELEVVELEGAAYDEYLSRAAEALGLETVAYARVFDISIVNGEGAKVQPSAPVAVSIELLDADATAADFSVVHFPDETSETSALSAPKTPDTMSAHTDGNTVSFDTTGFSAYAIVQGPGDVPLGWTQIKTLTELLNNAGVGLYIGTTGGYYLTNTTAVGSRDANTTGIVKTTPTQSFPPEGTAAKYYFEPVEGTTNQFYIYCLANDGTTRQYVHNTGDANLTFADEPTTPFNVTIEANTGRIRFNNGARYWNMWNGVNGNHIAAYDRATDGGNYFYVWRKDDYSGDPYGLNGLTYGLMNWNGGTAGKALMSTSTTPNNLDALPLTVMAKTGNTNDMDKLFVPSDSDISLWTFQWVDGNQYYLTTTIDGSRYYLKIQNNKLSVVNEPDDACKIQVIPGTGVHAGEVCLKSGNTTLTYTGKAETGFRAGGSAGSEWLKLVEVSELTSDYFLTYSAAKVSVSDPTVTNESRIIVYTRVWNEAQKRYDFYGVNHDGSLVRCFESGDDIQWVGSLLNSMLWEFTEYYWEGTTDPNFYYELYNQYSENYIAPQVSDGQTLSNNPIGINLNGRVNGQYYTPIMAWDENNYSYAGLKADVQAGKIVSCPISEADDFYFAILQDIPVDDTLTTVKTVDNAQGGITMKIVDFGTRKEMSDFLGSDKGGAVNTADTGLLSTNLVDGYPDTKVGNNLASWFADATEVNHLFVQSTYDATGYYEYDASQNFASLQGTDFVVYQEIASTNKANDAHHQHGQFFPYNRLEAGNFSPNKNLTNSGGGQLPDSDPRKGEQLYLVQNPNYYLGVEVNASFTQTPDGKDDWGHDIIYEFTGDDDFWLYVDGELIIDLGGIHNALSGSVNYKTGDVYVNGVHHTLRELFESNYRTRNPEATDTEVADYLAEYFDGDSTIFKDYTTHTMKIFYLERGAGASNLHMRFNLASVKPGTVQLSKALSGVDTTETITSEFPYQIKYKNPKTGEELVLTNAVPEDPVRVIDYVFYKDTTTPCKFLPQLVVDGVTYENVFMLKPGETVEVSLPLLNEDDDIVKEYSIVECGIDTNVYKGVYANGTELSGTSGSGYANNRKDYGLDYATTAERARVTYTNDVDPDALRTVNITKYLRDETGEHPISADEDQTTFNYRLYLGTEFEETPAIANTHTYHVKDPDGNYCKWDTETRRLVSLGAGKTVYEELTDAEKASARFTTSINGAITQIPVGYTVELRDVLAGTKFRVVERPEEVPDGYSFMKYEYKGESSTDADSGVTDTVSSNDDPQVDVYNLKGWGLRVNKVWSDEDYMTERAATYFAVFTRGEDDELTLVENPNTVRRLAYGENTLYWYFLPLPVDVPFNQYEIREVTLTEPVVDEDGVVTSYSSIAPIEDGGQLTLNGKQKGETSASDFEYTVLYEKGEVAEGSNVRVDTTTNNRPGVALKKTAWDGEPLAGAQFELKDAEGDLIGTFTSGADGVITVAFLRDDVTYTLTETKTPKAYHGLQEPMTITLRNGTVTVGGDVDSRYYTLDQGEGKTPTLTIKNRPYTLTAVKRDYDTKEPMASVTFALHKQRTVDGVTIIDPYPMVGYESLTTGANGVIPKIDNTLDPGTYELRETAAPSGYETLPYTKFTINDTGGVTLISPPEGVSLKITGEDDGPLEYELEILNVPWRKVSFKKVDVTAPESSALAGAEFDLYTDENGSRSATPLYRGMTSRELDGLLVHNSQTVFSLPLGKYYLVETTAPAGYNKMASEVVIYVTANGVTYDDGTSYSSGGAGSTYDRVTKVYTLKICNSPGAVLPHTGGPGTALYTVFGTALIVTGIAYGLYYPKRRALSRCPTNSTDKRPNSPLSVLFVGQHPDTTHLSVLFVGQRPPR